MKQTRDGNYIPMAERFDLLRDTDTRRRWKSLDDERVCLVCERKFAGRQIEFRRMRSGQVELHCPTEGCDATAREWVYTNDPRVIAARDPRRTPFFALAIQPRAA
jgi:hypothetical protein